MYKQTQTTTPTEVLLHKLYQQRQNQDAFFLYVDLLKKWEHHFRNRIDKIFLEADQLSLPIGFDPFEGYFTGFDFEYLPFDNSNFADLHGFHDITNGLIRIYYANNCPQYRQRFTIAHELIHVY